MEMFNSGSTALQLTRNHLEERSPIARILDDHLGKVASYEARSLQLRCVSRPGSQRLGRLCVSPERSVCIKKVEHQRALSLDVLGFVSSGCLACKFRSIDRVESEQAAGGESNSTNSRQVGLLIELSLVRHTPPSAVESPAT